jgi:hypothetical protein
MSMTGTNVLFSDMMGAILNFGVFIGRLAPIGVAIVIRLLRPGDELGFASFGMRTCRSVKSL